MRRAATFTLVKQSSAFLATNGNLRVGGRGISTSTSNLKSPMTGYTNALPSQPTAASSSTVPVVQIDQDGQISEKMVTKSSLLSTSKLHARDLVSLFSGVEIKRARPDILVRDACIVVCFSHIRAVIQHDRMLLFQPEREVVKSFVPKIATSITQKPNLPQPFEYLVDESVDFELRAMEVILSSVCETYRKRATMMAPLVDGVINRLSDSKTLLPDALHQLLPMKDNLSNFEIETGMARDVLNTLLKNDEDLLGLLLSERRRRHGAVPPLEAHRSVELMLENYCSQLVDISQEAYFLRKRVESIQSIVELNLNSHRNRLLHLSQQLSMGSVCISATTATAGFFGMNLVSGLENTPGTFWTVVALSSAGAGAMFVSLLIWSAKLTPNVDVRTGDFNIIFQHLDEIQAIFEKGSGDRVYFSKDEFRGALRALKVSEEAADLVWNTFETEEEENRMQRSASNRELRKLFDLNFFRRFGKSSSSSTPS